MGRLFDDGASEYLAAIFTPLSEPFTLSAWGYTDDATISSMLLSLGDADGLDYHGIRFRGTEAGDPVQATSWDGAAGGAADSSIGFSVNVWQHVLGVFPATNSRTIYLGGGSSGNDTTNVVVAGIDRVTIGISADSTPVNAMSGGVAELAIWDIALPGSARWLVAHGYPPWLVYPAHLIGFWLPFGDRTDRDFSGRGHHMTAYNTPTWGPDPPKVVSRYRINQYRHTDESGRVWWMPWPKPPAAIAGQPMNLRATTIPGMRQWHPRVG